MKFSLLFLLLVLVSCQTAQLKLTDPYEKGAFVEVPSYIEPIEINGRLIRKPFMAESLIMEIPPGRSELVVRFKEIYDTHDGDSHEKIVSDKMTFVFVAKEADHYVVQCPYPESIEEAQKMMSTISAQLLHRESGDKTNAVVGYIEERSVGFETKKPYQELKYWWKKATAKEKENFLKWSKNP